MRVWVCITLLVLGACGIKGDPLPVEGGGDITISGSAGLGVTTSDEV